MKTILHAAGLALIAGSVSAAIPVGRGEISASAAATVTYDSNLFGTNDATGDTFGTLTPRVSYLKKAGLIEASANAGISFLRYLEQTELDAENLDLDATLQITNASQRNYSGLVSAAYRESADVNTDINARIETQATTFIAKGALITGPRSQVATNANYSDTQRSIASDQQILSTDVIYAYSDFFYGNSLRIAGNYDTLRTSGENARGVALDQKSYSLTGGLNRTFARDVLRFGFNYGYRIVNRSSEENPDRPARQSGSILSVILEGPFLPAKYFPKITSSFSLSYQSAATPGINDDGSKELVGTLRLAWEARERTRVRFSAYRTQRLAVSDVTVVTTSVQLGLDQTLRTNLTGTLTAGYDWSTYDEMDRDDNVVSASAGLRYHFARKWDANLTYFFNSISSNLRESTFDRHVVSLSVSYQF
ncbi:outer membrane beta-barrel protein [Oleiharenicola lentus]|uniref:outer membrane beta-barrel protein n=1 Tax=Oleiharenicola lentus TaxID=2508720 RepID=UPI003F677CD6